MKELPSIESQKNEQKYSFTRIGPGVFGKSCKEEKGTVYFTMTETEQQHQEAVYQQEMREKIGFFLISEEELNAQFSESLEEIEGEYSDNKGINNRNGNGIGGRGIYSFGAIRDLSHTGFAHFYDTKNIMNELTQRLDKYLGENDDVLPGEFFIHIASCVDDFNNSKLTVDTLPNIDAWSDSQKLSAIEVQSGTALLFSQISTVINNPIFLKDPRCLKVLSKLSSKGSGPWINFNWTNLERPQEMKEGRLRSVPKEGFGSEHLSTLEKMIDSEWLWRTESYKENHYHPERPGAMLHLSSSISSLIEAIKNQDDSAVVWPLALKLLEYAIDFSDEHQSFIKSSAVYCFDSEEGQAALQEIVDNRPPLSKMRTLAKDILSGHYKNMAWC